MYCVTKGKYGLEISSCKGGVSWEEAISQLIYFNNSAKTEGD